MAVHSAKTACLLYRFLKVYVRLGMFVFCREVRVNNQAVLATEGPVLLACNHPDSFLDAMILDVLFTRPLWSLARGDVFKSAAAARILRKLRILPVYRTSEGVRNLSANYDTFDECLAIFREKGLVMIFSEGKCVNEWHLRPLKKGTARLAFRAWEQGLPVQVIPLGINYSAFRRFGKNVIINIGSPILAGDLDLAAPDGVRNHAFNSLVTAQLRELVVEIPEHDLVLRKRLLEWKPSLTKTVLLALPAVAGLLLHAPLYLPVRTFAFGRFGKSDHYDSIMTGLLLSLYPFYLMLLAGIIYGLSSSWLSLLTLIAIPFTAWACVQLKPQLDPLPSTQRG